MWRVWLLLLFVTALGGPVAGWKLHDWQDASSRLKAARVVTQTVQKDAAVTQPIVEREAAAQVEIRWRTRTVKEEIPYAVTAEADRDCVVPRGFVRVWNDASTGLAAQADPAAQPHDPGAADADAAPSGVHLTDIAGAHADDASAYATVARRLTDLQDWVAATYANDPPRH